MRFFAEADVRSGPTVPDVVEALEAVLAHEAEGTAWNVDKTMSTWPTGAGRAGAHGLGAVDLTAGLTVFKTWVNTPAGASALLTMFDATDGRTLGVAEAGTAGALRTAAVSGVATRHLADPGADELALLGAGRQALRQVEAVAAVRPLRRGRLWNRSAAGAEALAQRVRDELHLTADVAPTVEAATHDAPIVTTITRADEPFLAAHHLAVGAHLNAVGAILPSHAELAPDVLATSSMTVVDSEPNARRGSRELREHLGADPVDDWSGVRGLAELVVGKDARPTAPRLTVFKGMGMGLSDLAVAALLVGGRP